MFQKVALKIYYILWLQYYLNNFDASQFSALFVNMSSCED
jgi:hypothetical protein